MILSSNTSIFSHKHQTSPPKSTFVDHSHKQDENETPTTSDNIDCLIQDLQPFIHYTAQFFRLINWKDHKAQKYSVLLLFCWILWWTLYRLILSLLPILIIAGKVYYERHQTTTICQQTQHKEERKEEEDSELKHLVDDLTEIRDVIYIFSNIKDWIRKSDTLCRLYYKHYSIASPKQRINVLFSVAYLFTMVYAGWLILLCQQMITSCASLAWFLILVIMCVNSPWVNPVYVACVRALMPLIHQSLENTITATATTPTTTSSTNTKQLEQDDHFIHGYCFETYHHQRWWFPTGWSNLLLPQDRPVWSDIYLESTPSIGEFRLPPTTCIGKPNKQNQQRIVSWTWIDPTWSKYQATADDNSQEEGGWEYGSWNWKSWTFSSIGLGVCTRRQKWYRFAQRKESWIPAASTTMEEEKERKEEEIAEECSASSRCSSVVLSGSSSTSTSNSSLYEDDDWFNSSSMTPSFKTTTNSTTPSTAVEYSVKPLLISSIHEKSSTRRLSLQSVTFNTSPKMVLTSSQKQQEQHITLEEHDMYKQFCTTPKPQQKKIFKKRHSSVN